MLILLSAKTHKAKNVIKNHGTVWTVVRTTQTQMLIKTEHDLRWISKVNNVNFNWSVK